MLFVTSKTASGGQHGYFRLNGQFGYIFGNAKDKTPAHEVGHGVFKLEHPWSAYGTKEGKTNLLMDKNSGEIISHLEWKQINDPKLKLYAFQKKKEGEDRDNDGIDLLGNVIIKVEQNIKDQEQHLIIGQLNDNNRYLRSGYDIYKKVNGKVDLNSKVSYDAIVENNIVIYRSSSGVVFPYKVITATFGQAKINWLADKCYYSTTYVDWEKPHHSSTQEIVNLISKKVQGAKWENHSLFSPDPSCDKYNLIDNIKNKESRCNAETVSQEFEKVRLILSRDKHNDIHSLVEHINNSCSATLGNIEYNILLKNIKLILNQKNTFKPNVNEQSEIAILRLITAISFDDYPNFFDELRKNDEFTKKLFSEIDDSSIFFWDRSNYTGFVNLLLKMSQKLPVEQNPINILIKAGKIDGHFVKIENGKVKGKLQYVAPKQGFEEDKDFEADLFAPVDFIVVNKENYQLELKRIPAFYAYYLLNQRNTDAFFKYLSTYTDIYSIGIGLNNLAKLKELPKAYRNVKAVIAGAEITASSIDLLLNYSEVCNETPEVCENLRKLTFALNVATLSADIYTSLEIQQLNKKLPKEIAEKIRKVGGEYIVKRLNKVIYGSDDLSKFAIEFRKTLPQPNHRGNIAVFEYIDEQGSLVKKAFTTEIGSSLHSEEIAISYFKSKNIPNQNIKYIYSELEPCSLEGHMCKNNLQKNYPNSSIKYSYDYPGNNNASKEIIEIRRNSINQRAKDLNKLLNKNGN